MPIFEIMCCLIFWALYAKLYIEKEVKRMKLKYNFVLNNVSGTTVAVPVGKAGEQLKAYIKLNETGAFIFEMLKRDVKKEEIKTALQQNFEGVSEDHLEKALDAFLEKLKSADLLYEK